MEPDAKSVQIAGKGTGCPDIRLLKSASRLRRNDEQTNGISRQRPARSALRPGRDHRMDRIQPIEQRRRPRLQNDR